MQEASFDSERQFEPYMKWPVIQYTYDRAYQRFNYSDIFLDQSDEMEYLLLNVNNNPFNFMLGRPIMFGGGDGVDFWLQEVIALPHRQDVNPQLYGALEEDDEHLYRIRDDGLVEISKRRTKKLLELIEQSQILPICEFVEEVG